MNDMTPPNSAARLSDDIGDVLSAIRRLIAEDEAAEAVQSEEPEKIAVGAEYLAHRHGGNAALARQMVGHAPARLHVAPETLVDEGDDTFFGPASGAALTDLVVDHGDDLHPFEAELLRIDEAEDVALAPEVEAETTPLRLGEAERVSAVQDAAPAEEQAEPSAKVRRSRWARIESPLSRRFTLVARQEAEAEAEAESADDILPLPADALTEAMEPIAVAVEDLTVAAEVDQAEELTATEPGQAQQSAEVTLDLSYALSLPAFDAAAFSAPVFYQPEVVTAQVQMPAATLAAPEAAAEAPTTEAAAEANQPEQMDLNQDALRSLIGEMVQAELHGELGQRFSRNLRAVIRREVLAAIEDQADRF